MTHEDSFVGCVCILSPFPDTLFVHKRPLPMRRTEIYETKLGGDIADAKRASFG